MADTLFFVGVLQLTVVFLSIAAGVISIFLFKASRRHEILGAWKMLMAALVLFAVEEIVGVLDAFNIFREINFLRHIIPSFILAFLIIAIVKQLQITKVKQ
jgi:hypothetical protein